MRKTAYYEILIEGLTNEARVERIVHGVSWTAAVLSDGRSGVAMHTLGESRPRRRESLIGLGAREAGEAVLSWNFEEAGEGLAVINAFYNDSAREASLGCFYTANALEGIPIAGRTVGMIGHLVSHSGITEELLRTAGRVFILEKEPKPGDYPDSACEYLLPDCDLVVITGSAAVNKTMPRLLELAAGAEIVLTGPSVTLCPELFSLGIRRLNGSVIVRREEMLEAIVPERTSIKAYSRYWTLDRGMDRGRL